MGGSILAVLTVMGVVLAGWPIQARVIKDEVGIADEKEIEREEYIQVVGKCFSLCTSRLNYKNNCFERSAVLRIDRSQASLYPKDIQRLIRRKSGKSRRGYTTVRGGELPAQYRCTAFGRRRGLEDMELFWGREGKDTKKMKTLKVRRRR